MADEFFARFAERVAPHADDVAPPMPVAEPESRGGGRYIRWIALAAIAALLAYLALRGFR
jgi:hypothetical protein